MLAVGVLYGGKSGEHDVSLCSAASVVANLDEKKYSVIAIGIDRDGSWHVQNHPEIVDHPHFGKVLALRKTGKWLVNHAGKTKGMELIERESGRTIFVDIVFPVVHGTYCEDGTLQGLLELAGVPYVGADVAGSAIGMDKDIAKRLLRDAGLSVVPWKTIFPEDWNERKDALLSTIANEFGFPLFVKPANSGSSVGVRKAKNQNELVFAIESAMQFSVKVIVEKAIDCREIECAVLGNRNPQVSVLGEVVPHHEFYSYEAKYIDPHGASLKIPAEVSHELSQEIRAAALRAYRALCCAGMARVDFFLEKGTNRYFINEINTLPGFTTISMYPKLWEASNVSYGDLLTRLIELALERHREKQLLRTTL
ncbi:MAG: D-alanine--D-alanine ligase [Spirochaetes bacterium]|nr:D-alanine--D-alanine ligase [Spirochaetota bacterium]